MKTAKLIISRLSIFTALLVAGGFMLRLSWRRWPDVLVDFGRELYIPWQINSGAILYKDIAYFNGPLSSYFNALLFKIFGTSLMTIALFNVALITLLTITIYRIFFIISDRLTAFTTGLAFLAIFAFSQYVKHGNYNFVCPYSHDMTHGVLLSLLALYAFYLYAKKNQPRQICLSGLLFGLIFLTKIEVFLACGLAVSISFIALFIITKARPLTIVKPLSLFCATAALPLICFAAFFLSHMSISDLVSSIMSAYRSILKSDITMGVFYKGIIGLDDPLMNIAEMLYSLILYVTILSIIALTGAALARITNQLKRRLITASLIIGMICWISFTVYETEWITITAQGLPAAMIILSIYILFRLDKFRVPAGSPEEPARTLLLFSMTIFASGLLFKMFLKTHVYHYGFALAMPAFLLLIMVFLYLAPKFFGERLGSRIFMRCAGMVLIAACIYAHVIYSKHMLERKTYAIGSGSDAILTYNTNAVPAGAVLNDAIGKIRGIIPDGKSLAVLPEGVMLNYLMRIKNPTPYVNFMPLEFSVFGEEKILGAFKADPPDYIALADRDTGEYGYRFFGRDYAVRVYSWITDNYVPVQLFGKEPLTGNGFGIRLLKKRM